MHPVTRPLVGTVRPPGSKSLTNRALVCAALARGRSTLLGVLDSEDTQVMRRALVQLGLQLEEDLPARRLVIDGCGGKISVSSADLYVANSGTTMRFLTPLVCLGQGTFRLDGTPRMRERPIRDLLTALRALGVDATSETSNDCPPVCVRAAGLPGGTVRVRGDVSSQFLSGLLLATPCAARPVHLHVEGPLVSQPYVQMTLAVMQAFGVTVACRDLSEFEIPAPQPYTACTYAIEPDASAASYFFAAAAITGGRVTIDGLSRRSLQGDVAFIDVLARMGCRVDEQPDALTVIGAPLVGVDVDMNAISDTVQTLAAVALFARGPTTVRGVAHIRHKETDRLAALVCELRKLGALVTETSDGLVITPGPLRAATIDTYDDHRMAMSLALVGLRQAGVVIRDPDCTHKTYPGFFRDLDALVAAHTG